MKDKVIVRFAPSPTGFLHLGSARTALFNWLYARHADGKFILRIEDTDRERSKKEFLDEITEDLRWLGINWDEKPLFQSKRISIYKDYAAKLLDKGLAYREGEAVIFKVEKSRDIKMNDTVHGEIIFNTDEIKDQVLIKSDGLPAYNFACVVDDHEMGITHIIRGADHISNTPKQILFYEALGLALPVFAHMPLMMGKDGAKLSKRHGAVAVSEYRKEGFLPEALSNYLLLLGWSPGGDREVISLEEAGKLFDVKDLSNVQARFDIDKLKWINGEYIRTKSTEELFPIIEKRLKEAGISAKTLDRKYVSEIIGLYKTRIKTYGDFLPLTECFFKDTYTVDEKAKKKHLAKPEAKRLLGKFTGLLNGIGDFSAPEIEKACRSLADKEGVKASKIIHPSRVAISGTTAGAGLFEMMEVLGKKRVIARMKRVL